MGFDQKIMKEIVKQLIPSPLMKWRRQFIASREQKKFAGKSVAETFNEIYDKNLWGGEAGEFYSGEGSTEVYSTVYAENIQRFIEENEIETVVDLGCGDFRVGSQIASPEINYIGVDIVPALIENHRKKFANERVSFQCLNIVEDELPKGDLCLIRQVLQHLSNDEICKILQNCRDFKHLLITESYPSAARKLVPNIDIPHGPDMRLHFDSAVCLDQPPFSVKNVQLFLDVEAEEGNHIKTFLIQQ
jgi:SAM-dependent methyltransferase